MSAGVPTMGRNAKVWQFICPECGFGHEELGILAADDDLYCVVCLEERDVHVRLSRWTAPVSPAPQPAVAVERPDLAA